MLMGVKAVTGGNVVVVEVVVELLCTVENDWTILQ